MYKSWRDLLNTKKQSIKKKIKQENLMVDTQKKTNLWLPKGKGKERRDKLGVWN